VAVVVALAAAAAAAVVVGGDDAVAVAVVEIVERLRTMNSLNVVRKVEDLARDFVVVVRPG